MKAFCLLLPLCCFSVCRAADILIHLPKPLLAQVGNAFERTSAVTVGGKIDGQSVRFSELSPNAIYDIAIETRDGLLLCGDDLSWCDSTPADPQAEPLGDDDRESIRSIVQNIKSFANHSSILQMRGDHDRAVAIVSLVRDNGFHSDAGGEIIWRAEVWFFEWENGGWSRVTNQLRLLRRERFADRESFEKELSRVRWVPQLGGIRVSNGEQAIAIDSIALSSPTTVPSEVAIPATASTSRPTRSTRALD